MTADHPVVCCDLDGVVWRGDEPIPGAGAAISGPVSYTHLTLPTIYSV